MAALTVSLKVPTVTVATSPIPSTTPITAPFRGGADAGPHLACCMHSPGDPVDGQAGHLSAGSPSRFEGRLMVVFRVVSMVVAHHVPGASNRAH